ncbi:hypothetical protein STSO111631_17815 [Stackebrandtia soli]
MHRALRASDRRNLALRPLYRAFDFWSTATATADQFHWRSLLPFGAPYSRFTGVPYFRFTGVLYFRFTGVPYFRFTGVLYFRFTGVPYFRFTGVKSRVPMKSGRGRGAENGSTQVFSTLL